MKKILLFLSLFVILSAALFVIPAHAVTLSGVEAHSTPVVIPSEVKNPPAGITQEDPAPQADSTQYKKLIQSYNNIAAEIQRIEADKLRYEGMLQLLQLQIKEEELKLKQ